MASPTEVRGGGQQGGPPGHAADQPRAIEAPALVPARMVNEVLYCERIVHLEWAQQEFEHNAYTAEGNAVHARIDAGGGALPAPPAWREVDEEEPDEPAPFTARSVWLSSEHLGLTAKIDLVEGDADGAVVPVEYKRGAAPDEPAGAFLPERAQLCAQVLLLREHGYRSDEAAIWFARSRRRVAIVIDDALIATTLDAIARARAVVSRAEPPPPLEDSPKCAGCSLVGICLPDETNLLRRDRGEALEPATDEDVVPEEPLDPDPWGLAGSDRSLDLGLRRLHPARDDRLPLYVQEQGARVGLDGECLRVQSKAGSIVARLANTSQVALMGNVQLSTQAMRACLERDIPISFFSYGGWHYGRAVGHDSKNVELRIAQHAAAADASTCLALARRFVVAKIRNARTMLRRHHVEALEVALGELDRLGHEAATAPALASLLGYEGTAARLYFGRFTGMLRGDAAATGAFDLEGRNRRPPRDPINALLSFAYALLAKDFAVALSAVGLDPLLGFYHQPRFGRPALALDLMEEFRPIVGDSVVIGAINNGVFAASDFVVTPAAASLTPAARKRLIAAYERRMDQLVTHPVFGYRISYRRVLEVQARLLARLLLGEIREYPSFLTR